MAAFADKPIKKAEPEDDGLRIVFIDKKTDVFHAQAVLGPAPIEFYQKKIISDLLEQAMKRIKPELEEKEGYEVIKYDIVIKQLPSA